MMKEPYQLILRPDDAMHGQLSLVNRSCRTHLDRKRNFLNSAESARTAADQPSCCQSALAQVHAQNEHAIFLNAGFSIVLTDLTP